MKQMEKDKEKKDRKLQTFTVTKNWTPHSRAGTQYLLVTRTYEKATAFP